MKNLFLFVVIVMTMLLTSCADSKTFEIGGKLVEVEPYGWANRDVQKVEGVEYQICAGNLVWDIILSETIVVPVILTGYALYEPVKYTPIVK